MPSTRRHGSPSRATEKRSTARVFISYNSKDRLPVERIVRKITSSGISVWFDQWNLIAGEPWQPAIEQALLACDSCAVFVGRSATGPWQHEEMRYAINRRVHSVGFAVIPVFLPGSPREPGGLSDFLLAGHAVRFRKLDDREALRLLVAGILGQAPGPSSAGSSRIVYEAVITGSFQKSDKRKVEAIFEHLRKLSDDADLTLKAVRDGSLIMILEGALSGYLRLRKLLARRQLPEFQDISVARISRHRDRVHAEGLEEHSVARGRQVVASQKPSKPNAGELPIIKTGDTVRVLVRIRAGRNERLQTFEGMVINISRGGARASITIRKVSFGQGVDRIFPLHSPTIERIEVIRPATVRRAKLHFLRNLRGKRTTTKKSNAS